MRMSVGKKSLYKWSHAYTYTNSMHYVFVRGRRK